MPLRLDNARALPTCPQQEEQPNKSFEPRFKIDHAASPMPEIRQPERLAPRATSNRKGGRDHLGILGEIKSVHPGEIIGISNKAQSALDAARRKHEKNAADIQTQIEVLEEMSQAEDAHWEKERERLEAALRRARG